MQLAHLTYYEEKQDPNCWSGAPSLRCILPLHTTVPRPPFPTVGAAIEGSSE